MLIPRSIRHVVGELIATQQLELRENSTETELVTEILTQIADAPPYAQLGPFLSKALIASPHVEELFADDSTLIEIITTMLQ